MSRADRDAELAAALQRVLAAELGRGVEVANLTRLSGGASRATWAFDLRDGGSTRPLILQRERPGGLRPGGMGLDARLLRAARETGVVVPQVVATGAGDDLGGSFLVTERIEGETIPRRLLRDDEYAAARPNLAFDAGVQLARIHRIDPKPFRGDLAAQDQLEQFRGILDAFGEPHPAFELGFRWLERHRPPAVEPCVVHGDFRTGNLVVDASGIRAVLDWELTHLGDPVEDLGWFCVRAWRFGGRGRAGGFGPLEQLLDGYRSESGRDVDPELVRWWEAVGTLKWGIMCMVQASAHLSGSNRSVELAAIGRRTCENEHDLLELLR